MQKCSICVSKFVCMCKCKYGQLNSSKSQILFQGGAGADSEKIVQEVLSTATCGILVFWRKTREILAPCQNLPPCKSRLVTTLQMRGNVGLHRTVVVASPLRQCAQQGNKVQLVQSFTYFQNYCNIITSIKEIFLSPQG